MDPLSLLRQFNIENKAIIEQDGKIIFGEFSWPKDIKTNYLEWPTGKKDIPKDYYTLECLLYLLKNKSLVHPVYVRCATAENKPVIRRPDRKDLLAYLNGEIISCPAIDKCASLPTPTCVKRSIDSDAHETVTKKPRTDNTRLQKAWEKESDGKDCVPIKSLLDVMSAEKIAAIKAKHLALKKSFKGGNGNTALQDRDLDIT